MSLEKNIAAVQYGQKDIRLEERPIPIPNPDQVHLKIEVVGICGSDVHFLVHGNIGSYVVTKPMVVGHEAAGIVVECGSNVNHLKPGDKVAIEPGAPCSKCSYCKEGAYNLCKNIYFCATPPDDGILTRYFAHDASFCYKLPENMDLEEGALMEPLAVAVRACKRGQVGIGSMCLILGAGPIGLMTLLTAKAMGASKVLVVDLIDDKLDRAKELGADCTLKITKSMTNENIVERVKSMLGEEPTVSLDCSGVDQTGNVALDATKSGGVIVFVGLADFNKRLPITGALLREIDIKGVFRYCNDYLQAIALVQSGRVNVKPLITHHFGVLETLRAFQTAETGNGNPIKILIHLDPNWRGK